MLWELVLLLSKICLGSVRDIWGLYRGGIGDT